MKNLFVRFIREEAGQDLIEYGLLIGIITIGVIGSVKALAPTISGFFTTVNTNLTTTPAP